MKPFIPFLLLSFLFFSCSSDNSSIKPNDDNDINLPYVDDITTKIKDPNFRKYIKDNIDTEFGECDIEEPYGILSSKEVAKIEILKLSYLDIKSLDGIEYFIGLKTLIVNNNQITTIDIPNQKQLEILEININSELEVLNLSNQVKLKQLRFMGDLPKITKLDLSTNTQLEHLSSMFVNFKEINIDNCTKLESLGLEGARITSLNLLNKPKLTFLSLAYTNLTELDISNNRELDKFYLFRNPIHTIYVWKGFNNKFNFDGIKMIEK